MEEDLIKSFTDFADKYNDYIDDIKVAEVFLSEFMQSLNRKVVLDFIDSNYWDCIRDYKVDSSKGLIYLYWFLPEDDPIEKQTRQMAFPYDYYGIVFQFKSVEFIRDNNRKCFAICLNSYTTKDSEVVNYLKKQKYTKYDFSKTLSFFSIEYVYLNNGESAYMRYLKTPIKSFWIIPKQLIDYPQKSKEILYKLNLKECYDDMESSMNDFSDNIAKNPKGKKLDRLVSTVGNQMRQIAENIFKLMICFYSKRYNIKYKSYNDLMIGDLVEPLKKHVYASEDDHEHLNTIRDTANKFSHYTGLRSSVQEIGELYIWLKYYINDFKLSVERHADKEVPKAEVSTPKNPSPEGFLKANVPSMNFLDIIAANRQVPDGNAYFLIECTTKPGFTLPVQGGDLLCVDGTIQHLIPTEYGKELHIYSREEAKSIVSSIYRHLEALCRESGLDDSNLFLYVRVDATIVINKTPKHLFTEDEIRDVTSKGDNSKPNRLVIDENGYPQLINDIDDGHLYPVWQEAWGAGENAVGADSTLSQVHECYVIALHCWLDYLQSGTSVYGDMYYSDKDVEEIKQKILKFYNN